MIFGLEPPPQRPRLAPCPYVVICLAILAALLATSCAGPSDPVFDIDRGDQAAPRDAKADVTLPDLTVEMTLLDHDDDPATPRVPYPTTVKVTGGSVVHDVRQSRAEPVGSAWSFPPWWVFALLAALGGLFLWSHWTRAD